MSRSALNDAARELAVKLTVEPKSHSVEVYWNASPGAGTDGRKRVAHLASVGFWISSLEGTSKPVLEEGLRIAIRREYEKEPGNFPDRYWVHEVACSRSG